MATHNESARQPQQNPPPGHPHPHPLNFQAPMQPLSQPPLELPVPSAALPHYHHDSMHMAMWDQQPTQSPSLPQAMEWDRAAAAQDANLDLMEFGGLEYPQPDQFMASMAERSPYPLVSNARELE